MPAGVQIRQPNLNLGELSPPKPQILPTSQFGNPATFTAAANTQASDYDTIMKQYQDIINKSTANPITSMNLNPRLSTYSQSPDVTSSLSNLSDLTRTGGYSDSDISNIRERDISPIRSIYANAQENVERNKALTGGYSPNFNAVQSKMARDEANKIADVTTNANAGIAQNVVSNKIATAVPYASASANANAARTASDQANVGIVNQINEGNATRGLAAATANRQNANNAAINSVHGMSSLYGTTPALTNTFGNQVIQAGQMGQTQQQIDQQKQRDIFNLAGRA